MICCARSLPLKHALGSLCEPDDQTPAGLLRPLSRLADPGGHLPAAGHRCRGGGPPAYQALHRRLPGAAPAGVGRHRRHRGGLSRPAGTLGRGFLPAVTALQPHRPGGGAAFARAGVCHRDPIAGPLLRQASLRLAYLPHHQRHRGDHEPLCAGDRAPGAEGGAPVRHPPFHGAAGSAPDAGVRRAAAGGGGRDVALPAPERARGAGDPQPALRHQQSPQRVASGDAGHSGHGAGAPLRQRLRRGQSRALGRQDQGAQDQRHPAAPPHRSLLHDGAHRPAGPVCPRGAERGGRHPGGGALRLHQLSRADDRAPDRDDQPAQPVATGHGGGGAGLRSAR
ncbi:Uncharacterised protein [Aeromonas hydrophila]|nr:Uncharacterised protein [Aeromonas hydrophila]